MSFWPILAGGGVIRVTKNGVEDTRWRKLMILAGVAMLLCGLFLVVF